MPQLYGSFAPAAGPAPAWYPRQQLLAFSRLPSLGPGSATPVSFTVPRASLALYSEAAGGMAVSPGTWTLTLGGGPPSNAQFPGGGAVLTGTLKVAAAV